MCVQAQARRESQFIQPHDTSLLKSHCSCGAAGANGEYIQPIEVVGLMLTRHPTDPQISAAFSTAIPRISDVTYAIVAKVNVASAVDAASEMGCNVWHEVRDDITAAWEGMVFLL